MLVFSNTMVGKKIFFDITTSKVGGKCTIVSDAKKLFTLHCARKKWPKIKE